MNSYYLKIADDTGDIEFELAPLEASQKVGRFGFNDLALVEKGDASEPNSPMMKSVGDSTFNFLVPGKQVAVFV